MNHSFNKMQIQKRIILPNREKIIPNSKNKINKKIKNLKSRELPLLLLISITFSFLAPFICSNNEIILKIDGIGNKTFIKQAFRDKIKSLVINNKNQSTISNTFDFTGEKNTVKITFKEKLSTCNQMFYALKAITEIGLSQFDFSEVTDMTSMFQNCSSLNIIKGNGGNMNKVKLMNKLFLGCIKLKSLNL